MRMKVYSLGAILRGGPFGPAWHCSASVSCAPANMSKEQVFEDYVRDQSTKNPGVEFAAAAYIDELSVAELEHFLAVAKQEE